MGPAIDDQLIKGDPFARLKKVRRPHELGEAHPIWEDEEVEIAIEDAIATGRPGLARAYALGRYGGFRKGTICLITLNARTKGGRLYWLTEKRKVLCDKRADPRLLAVLDRTPSKALTMSYDADGNPWKERALGHAVKRHNERLSKPGHNGGPGKVRAGLGLHGLRHARGVELAEGGATDAEIMAQLEHATDRAAKIYRRQAKRRKLADAGQDKVDNVTSLERAKNDAV
ncbi:MAG: integrase family protein [Caulobacter sp.]|nr:integrase family protein [Caulobacter sp.]